MTSTMQYNRRHFIAMTSAATAGILLRPKFASASTTSEFSGEIEDPYVKQLVQAGLDAAQGGGATYADLRLTHVREGSENQFLAASARALVDGCWGFACTPLWSTAEMQRIAREAVATARVNALLARPTQVLLAPVDATSGGHWNMPVRLNPFKVPLHEMGDYLSSLSIYMERTQGVMVLSNSYIYVQTQKAFGSTDNRYYTQRLYRSSGSLKFRFTNTDRKMGFGMIDRLTWAGEGWELIRDQPIREAFHEELEEIKFDLSLPIKPVDVGRFNVVFDAQSTAEMLSKTIGDATQLTRAMGYNANDRGTSYLTDPADMLGNFRVGADLINVSTNRSDTGGLSTVQWDEEGVRPEDTQLLSAGKVVGMTTTRESATWLQSSESQLNARSSGFADAESAIDVPQTITGNLHLAPDSRSTADFLTMIDAMGDGIAFRRMSTDVDFQCLNGFGIGKAYEVKKGKRVALLANAAILFRTPELWKSVQQLGGPGSTRRFSGVTAVPIMAENVTVIDALRKA